MADCPKCQHRLPVDAIECPRCGVILEKVRNRPPGRVGRGSPSPPRKESAVNSSRPALPGHKSQLPAFLLLLLCFAWITSLLVGRHEKTRPAGDSVREAPEQSAAESDESRSDIPEEGANDDSSRGVANLSDPQSDDDAVHDLLRRQSDAILSQNPDAFLATFHTQKQKSARFLLDQLLRLPISSYRQLVSDESRQGLLLQQWIEFEGMESWPFLLTRPIEVLKEAGEPRISVFGKADSFVLWEHESIEVTRTNHFLVFTHPSRSSIRSEVVRVIETAWIRLYQSYLPMADRYAAFVPGDPSYFGRVSGDSLVAGVATWRHVEDPDGLSHVVNPSLFLNPVLFRAGVNPDIRLQALMHEMVHLALADATHAKTPNWLVEGSAVFFSGGYTQGGESARLGRVLDRMSVQRTRTLSTVEEYAYAGAAVEYLVDEQGIEHFLAFYQAVHQERGDIDAALDRFYATTTVALDLEVKDWLVAMHRLRS